MNKKDMLATLLTATSLIASLTTLAAGLPQQTVYMGTIQWPSELKKTPTLRMYHAGHQLACEVNNETRQITFAVPESRDIPVLCIIVTEPKNIKLHMAEDNTISHLELKKDTAYKCLQLTRVTHELPAVANSAADVAKSLASSESWTVEQRTLRTDNLIPDNAIILCCNPEFMNCSSGGNSFELPTLVVSKDIVKKLGSETAVHEKADTLLLSCLDLDTLHTKLTYDVKQEREKMLVAFKIM